MRRWTFSLVAVLFFSVLNLAPAHAELSNQCQLVKQLSDELGCSGEMGGGNSNAKDYVMESSFGPSACKTAPLVKDLIKDLKGECTAWLKERKSDLGSKHLTGTCSHVCENCPTAGLQRCTVKGIVHYNK